MFILAILIICIFIKFNRRHSGFLVARYKDVEEVLTVGMVMVRPEGFSPMKLLDNLVTEAEKMLAVRLVPVNEWWRLKLSWWSFFKRMLPGTYGGHGQRRKLKEDGERFKV
jgi:hypothetical protein